GQGQLEGAELDHALEHDHDPPRLGRDVRVEVRALASPPQVQRPALEALHRGGPVAELVAGELLRERLEAIAELAGGGPVSHLDPKAVERDLRHAYAPYASW